MRYRMCTIVACAALALPAAQVSAAPGQWHFKVTNATSVKIVKLQVSRNKKEWGFFDIGGGIEPDDTMTLVWDSSTDDQACDQWIRAEFSDGGYSSPSKQNFCEDLDTPIVFSEGAK